MDAQGGCDVEVGAHLGLHSCVRASLNGAADDRYQHFDEMSSVGCGGEWHSSESKRCPTTPSVLQTRLVFEGAFLQPGKNVLGCQCFLVNQCAQFTQDGEPWRSGHGT